MTQCRQHEYTTDSSPVMVCIKCNQFHSDIRISELEAKLSDMRKPTKEMIDRGVAFALNVSLSGNYTWSDYVGDLYRHMSATSAGGGE